MKNLEQETQIEDLYPSLIATHQEYSTIWYIKEFDPVKGYRETYLSSGEDSEETLLFEFKTKIDKKIKCS